MADTPGSTPHALMAALTAEPWRFEFFQALRLIECRFADRPRLGESTRAGDDPVRLGQAPELDFAPGSLAEWGSVEGVPLGRLLVRCLGLFGPNGPMPLHLTEYAHNRLHHEKDPTFARFADIFHHRMLSLFYRAWANARPVVGHDRPADDDFPHYVGALFGLGMETQWQRDAMADPAKFHFAGLLACQTRHPDGLRAIIRAYLGLATDIQEFVGEWMDIPVRDQTRLGVSPAIASLGFSTVVGARVWGCQHKFRIVLGPMEFAQYRALLPGGETLSELVAIVRNYIGDELAWDVKLLLKAEEVPPLGLTGNSLLGWTSWSGERDSTTAADDLCLNPFFRNYGKVDGFSREARCTRSH